MRSEKAMLAIFTAARISVLCLDTVARPLKAEIIREDGL
jgi:hypothetical protein